MPSLPKTIFYVKTYFIFVTLGWFVYVKTSWPRLNKEKARLVSPDLDISTNCLEFYYHMFGDMVKTLNVYLRSSSGDVLIWTLSKNQGDNWKRAQVPLVSSALKSQVSSVRYNAVEI
jgi:hypothetical protein